MFLRVLRYIVIFSIWGKIKRAGLESQWRKYISYINWKKIYSFYIVFNLPNNNNGFLISLHTQTKYMEIHSSYFISEGRLINERFIKPVGWECIRLTLTLCNCWTCCVVVDPWCPTSNNNRLLYNWRTISEYSEQLARCKGLWCCTVHPKPYFLILFL